MAHILITGHSRGLGSAIAEQLLDLGHHVLGLSRNPHRRLGKPYGQQFRELSVDLGQPQAISAFLSTSILEDFFRSADQALLINNAGLLTPIGPAGTLPQERILESVTVNIAAALGLANQFIATTAACADRRIAHISSGAGRSPYAGWGVYCASKAALDHHARCLNLELQGRCRVESIAPGIIDTGMQSQIRAASLEQFPMRPKFDQLKETGSLAPAEGVAKKLIGHLFSDAYGDSPCSDLRDF